MSPKVKNAVAKETRYATKQQEQEWREMTADEGGPRVVGSLRKNREWDRQQFETDIDTITEAGKHILDVQTRFSPAKEADLRDMSHALGDCLQLVLDRTDGPLFVQYFALLEALENVAEEIQDSQARSHQLKTRRIAELMSRPVQSKSVQ